MSNDQSIWMMLGIVFGLGLAGWLIVLCSILAAIANIRGQKG
jgi:hypothetical protein